MKVYEKVLSIAIMASLLGGCAASSSLEYSSSESSKMAEREDISQESSGSPEEDVKESESEDVAGSEGAGEDIDYTTGSPWLCSLLDSNITDNTQKPDLKDDFFLACNLEYLQSIQYPEGYSAYGTMEAATIQTREDIADLFTGNTEAMSHDAQLALNLYSLYMDWDSRNAVGVAPLKEMVDAVEAIDSIDAMSDYLSGTPLEDQLYKLYSFDTTADLDDSSVCILSIKPPKLLLDDSDEYKELTSLGQVKKEAKSALASRIMCKMGYTEENAREKIENCLAFETKLSSQMISETGKRAPDYIDRINNHYTHDELKRVQGTVPVLGSIETAAGYPEADSYLLLEPDWLTNLDSLYTDENLSEIKDYLIVRGIISKAGLLDRECYDWLRECFNQVNGSTGDLPVEIVVSASVSEDLKWPVARLYCETYLSQDDKDRISDLIDKIVDEYRGILEEADFLTDTTKGKAIEKLDAITKGVLWPDDWSNYECSGLDIASASDDGKLWEAESAIARYDIDQKIKEYSEPIDKEKWEYPPTVFNCGYDPSKNKMIILGAFARGDIYNSEMSDEVLYSRLGIVIGHEISHAFDSTGSQFDKDGNKKEWWTDEDRKAFEERNEKLESYLNSITLWEGQENNGKIQTGEVCADMGGVKCMLRLASKMKDFDYDEFYRSFANLWASKGALNFVYYYLTDEHPMSYLRVNVPLQQYDEFLDFYDIKEGDRMYLSPENRVTIW